MMDRDEAYKLSLQQIRSGDILAACRTVADYELSQPQPRGLFSGVSPQEYWARYPEPSDVEILPELKKAASKQEKKAKLHQFLTNDVGHPKLREHLSSIVTILKLSKDKEDFKRMLNIAHPKLNHTMDIDF